MSWLPGQTIIQLMVAGIVVIASGLLLALAFCVEPEHRIMVREMVLKQIGGSSLPFGSDETGRLESRLAAKNGRPTRESEKK
jgi:hypothetical protein